MRMADRLCRSPSNSSDGSEWLAKPRSDLRARRSLLYAQPGNLPKVWAVLVGTPGASGVVPERQDISPAVVGVGRRRPILGETAPRRCLEEHTAHHVASGAASIVRSGFAKLLLNIFWRNPMGW